jgi:hypothetical protein
MNKLMFFLKLLFTNKDTPCPYWNFYNRRCMCEEGHSRGFDTIDYCRHIDAVSQCLHYKIAKI